MFIAKGRGESLAYRIHNVYTSNGNESQLAWKCIQGWEKQEAKSQSFGVPFLQVAPHIFSILRSNEHWTLK
jgi:hypothetical protein